MPGTSGQAVQPPHNDVAYFAPVTASQKLPHSWPVQILPRPALIGDYVGNLEPLRLSVRADTGVLYLNADALPRLLVGADPHVADCHPARVTLLRSGPH